MALINDYNLYFKNKLQTNNEQYIKFDTPLQITGLNVEVKPGTGQIIEVKIKDNYLNENLLSELYT
jgi:hypothetical protein